MRARKLLHDRLTRRGLAPAVALLVTATAARAATAAVPSTLAHATVRAGVRAARGGQLAGAVGPSAADLASRVLGSMRNAKLAATASGLTGLCLAAVVASLFLRSWQPQRAAGGPAAIGGTEAPSGPPHRVTPPPHRGPARERPGLAAPAAGGAPARALERVARPAGAAGGTDPAAGDGHAARPAGAADPDSEVRQALRSERNGQPAERAEHLARAVLADPEHAAARGLLGLVRYQGRWRRPEAVAALARADTAATAARAHYVEKRRRTPATADAQFKLALWCEQEGLPAEATAHLVAATRLAPDHEAAWKRLGRKHVGGRWLTDAQAAAERAEARAQREGQRHWKPLLVKWRAWLADKDRRADAESGLAGVTDPYAAQAVWSVFVGDDFPDHDRAVRLLGQIDAPAATQALGVLAVVSPSGGVRKAACETLARRDARGAVRLLVGLLRDPLPNPETVFYRVQWLPAGTLGLGSPGVTLFETPGANFLRFYTVDESRIWFLRPLPAYATSPVPPGYVGRIALQQSRQAVELRQGVTQVERELARDVLPVVVSLKGLNATVIQALRNITGTDQGDRWEDWKRWWTEGLGYAYDPAPDRNPPDFTFYQAKPSLVSVAHMSCFAAGTPVTTLTGPRPIEAVRTGDRVLTQDVATGALSFEPVVATYANAPAPTWRVEFEDASVVATGIHRFWKAGGGWVMARDLKPGDDVRTAGGLARVARVSADEVRPVFNLEVHEGQSFFAGVPGVLVHDNTVVRPAARPFDAPPTPDAGHG
jgi:hypothetical protein